MFAYSDPGKTLKPARALANYRLALHMEYSRSAKLSDSACTMLEAFEEVPAGRKQSASIEWAAFPRSATATNEQIDSDRFGLQDEYVEWSVERAAGRVKRITFTTDFLAYYEALARVGPDELIAAIQAVIPGAKPRVSELFGPGFAAATSSEDARANKFRQFAQRNPWMNGNKGIVCLAHSSNTLTALFRLVDVAAVPNPSVQPGAICGTLNGNCVKERNSDPNIAAAAQSLARNDRSLALADPCGIEIASLAGIWRIGDEVIDINDGTSNKGIWKVTRSGRRGELILPADLLLDDAPITSGAHVAAALRVKASVISAANADLPEWARLGHENSQRLADVTSGGVQ